MHIGKYFINLILFKKIMIDIDLLIHNWEKFGKEASPNNRFCVFGPFCLRISKYPIIWINENE